MSTNALDLLAIRRPYIILAVMQPLVIAARHRLQVISVYARSIPANVMQDNAALQRAELVLPDDSVRPLLAQPAIAPAVYTACPLDALAYRFFSHESTLDTYSPRELPDSSLCLLGTAGVAEDAQAVHPLG